MDRSTAAWTVDQLVARLAERKEVVGVLAIGSLGREALRPASDYDLVLVLRRAVRPWYVGVTEVDGRLTDLIFVDAGELGAVLELDRPITPDHPLAPVIRWLRQGRVLYSGDARLGEAREKVGTGRWLLPPTTAAAYDAWFRINYNLAQTRRLLAAKDALYRQTAAIRMALYGHSDLWFGYFSIRRRPWEGDKAAVRYLREADPEFLVVYERLLAAAGAEEKFSAYERAAALAAAPLGGVWPVGATVMNVEQGAGVWRALLDTQQEEIE
jgi:hypothetical protein